MKKKIAITLGILFLMLCIIGYSFYRKIYAPNVKETVSVFIPTGTTIKELIPILDPHIRNMNGFIWVAEKKNLGVLLEIVLEKAGYDLALCCLGRAKCVIVIG